MEDARVSSSDRENPEENPSFLLQDCRKDQRPGEVDYETRLPDLGEKPNQPTSFNFPKRRFGIKSVTYRSFQPVWFRQWPWISYDQEHDRAYCFCCVQAVRQEKVRCYWLTSKTSDAFLTQGFTNWKDATGAKHGGFPLYELSQVRLL